MGEILTAIRNAAETTSGTMKALVYRGSGVKSVEERPKPLVQAADDAVVKLRKTTICGTDLHILKGDVPTCAPGRILGHEGVGVIDSVAAPASPMFKPGDQVLISCITSCGKCEYCRRGMYSHCADWRLDSGQQDRWHPGRVCPNSSRRHQPLPHPARRRLRMPW